MHFPPRARREDGKLADDILDVGAGRRPDPDPSPGTSPMGPTLRTPPAPSSAGSSASGGIPDRSRGRGLLSVINGAGSGKIPRRRDSPDGEVVLRDVKYHRPTKKLYDGRMELPAGAELETRAKGPLVDEDADQLPHDRFGIFP